MKTKLIFKKALRASNIGITAALCLAILMAGCGAGAPEPNTTAAIASTAASRAESNGAGATTGNDRIDSTIAATTAAATTEAPWFDPAYDEETTTSIWATTTASPAANTAAAVPDAVQDVYQEDWSNSEYTDNADVANTTSAAASNVPPESNERYIEIVENKEIPVNEESMFTFSLKVDTASYNNVQRYIESGSRPPADAVKIEEMINYFRYDETLSFNRGEPFAISAEIGQSPFDAHKYLAYVRVKARDIDKDQLPPCNFTFLIDTSGSMDSYERLPLLQTSFGLLVDTLSGKDKVSIVTYAGSSRIVLDSASGADKESILNAIYSLKAGGSTAGGEGIVTAYRLAEKNFMPNGNNRIILATDGDFNVGITSQKDLEQLVSQKRDSGIYLSILGYGMGNYRDDTMETLAKNGNGNASYINSVSAAKKVLVDELTSNLYVIADDVKAQIELNPQNIKSYRLIGYENRALENKDFADDSKDAGEVGVGSDIVLLFEFELNGSSGGGDDEYKYVRSSTRDPQSSSAANTQQYDSEYSDELFEVRLRFKAPGEAESRLMLHAVGVEQLNRSGNSDDFRFASAVASFGHLLRRSSYLGRVTIDEIINEAQNSIGRDTQGYRYEFIKLLLDYQRLGY